MYVPHSHLYFNFFPFSFTFAKDGGKDDEQVYNLDITSSKFIGKCIPFCLVGELFHYHIDYLIKRKSISNLHNFCYNLAHMYI
jgi:hypothetical protein